MSWKDGGTRLSAGLVVITGGYDIDPDFLAWAHNTPMDKKRKASETERAGRLERIKLKETLYMVLPKGAIPEAGNWNNYDIKVTIQWFKRVGDKAMPKNKNGLMLQCSKTHTHVAHDGGLTRTRMWIPWSLIVRRLLILVMLLALSLPKLAPRFALAAAGCQVAAYVDHTRVATSIDAATTVHPLKIKTY
jgi:hypothetical protein